MDVNLLAVLAASVVMFIIGAIWYTAIFGKLWGKIHGFDKLSAQEQKAMQSKMGPWYGLQLVITIITAWVLAVLISLMPDQSPYLIAFYVWLGFAMPVTVSDMLFGGSPPAYVQHKIAITAGESLIHLLAAAWVISLF